jgi:hypothetical protein
MKTLKKQIRSMSLILSILILFQSCKTYQSAENLSQSRKIAVSEDLIKIAKAYPVKEKTHKNYVEFECGNYHIVNSEIKTEPVAVTYKSNEDVEINDSHYELNFVLTNNLGQTANIVTVCDVKRTYSIKENLFLHLLGLQDEPEVKFIEVIHIEKTTITTSYDIENEWTLNYEYTYVNDKKTLTITLTGCDRLITIVEAKPLKNRSYKMTSAPRGYEFVENNESLCAYQTLGGAAIGFGQKKQIIWLRPDIDEETNLVLVAAMGALKLIY